MSLVWALGKNTSPGRQVGVNSKLLYLMDLCPVEYSDFNRLELQHMASPLTPKIKVVNLQALSGILFR